MALCTRHGIPQQSCRRKQMHWNPCSAAPFPDPGRDSSPEVSAVQLQASSHPLFIQPPSGRTEWACYCILSKLTALLLTYCSYDVTSGCLAFKRLELLPLQDVAIIILENVHTTYWQSPTHIYIAHEHISAPVQVYTPQPYA